MVLRRIPAPRPAGRGGEKFVLLSELSISSKGPLLWEILSSSSEVCSFIRGTNGLSPSSGRGGRDMCGLSLVLHASALEGEANSRDDSMMAIVLSCLAEVWLGVVWVELGVMEVSRFLGGSSGGVCPALTFIPSRMKGLDRVLLCVFLSRELPFSGRFSTLSLLTTVLSFVPRFGDLKERNPAVLRFEGSGCFASEDFLRTIFTSLGCKYGAASRRSKLTPCPGLLSCWLSSGENRQSVELERRLAPDEARESEPEPSRADLGGLAAWPVSREGRGGGVLSTVREDEQ